LELAAPPKPSPSSKKVVEESRRMADAHYMCKKQKSFAWAKYYSSVNERLNADYAYYEVMRRITTDTDANKMPEHIIKSIAEMGAALKKTWDCAICQDIIKPDDLDITNCGHYFCKGCMEEHKRRGGADCKCPTCRRKI
jgi:hypothetical protein